MFCTSASTAVATMAKPLTIQKSWNTGLKCGLDTIDNNAAMNTKSHTATPRQPAWAGEHGEGMNTPPPRTMPSHAF